MTADKESSSLQKKYQFSREIRRTRGSAADWSFEPKRSEVKFLNKKHRLIADDVIPEGASTSQQGLRQVNERSWTCEKVQS